MLLLPTNFFVGTFVYKKNLNYRQMYQRKNLSVFQIWAGNFSFLLLTKKFVDKFVGKKNLNY